MTGADEVMAEVPLADLRYIMDETYELHENCGIPECAWYKLRKIADEP